MFRCPLSASAAGRDAKAPPPLLHQRGVLRPAARIQDGAPHNRLPVFSPHTKVITPNCPTAPIRTVGHPRLSADACQVAIASTDYCMRAVHQRGLTLEMIEQFANEHPEAWDRPTAEIVHDVIVPKTNRFFGASKAPKDGKEEDGTAGAGAAAAASAVKRDRQQERGVTKQSQALALMAAEKEHCVRKAPCRFTDVVEPKHVGMPDVFVVHAWTAPFGLLVAACRQFADCLARGEGEFGAKTSAMANVRHHFSEHPPEAIRFWIDIFAVMQCDGDGKEGDLGGIPASVSTSRFTLVVVDSATRAALRRMWCLYEIVVTASTQQQHPAGEARARTQARLSGQQRPSMRSTEIYVEQ